MIQFTFMWIPANNIKVLYIAAQSFDIKKHLRICTNDMLGSFGEVSIKKVLTKLGIN